LKGSSILVLNNCTVKIFLKTSTIMLVHTENAAASSMKGYGYAVRVSLIAALGGFLFGFETAVISGAEKTIQQLWSLSSGWLGFTVASSLIGTVIGSLVTGVPAQTMAEKKY
jgi:hypothetical protein